MPRTTTNNNKRQTTIFLSSLTDSVQIREQLRGWHTRVSLACTRSCRVLLLLQRGFGDALDQVLEYGCSSRNRSRNVAAESARMTWVRLAMRWNGALAAAAVPKRIAIDFELDEASQLQDMIGQVDQIVVDQTQRGQTRDVANLGQQLGEAVLVEIQCSKRTTHQVGRKP